MLAAIAAIVAAAGAGLYLYTRMHSVAPRPRRLAFVERALLDGGRKLVLVRRDGVEHLILIGGPIDLVVETGIPAELPPKREAAEDAFAGAVQSYAETARTWQRTGIVLPTHNDAGQEPDFSPPVLPEAKEAAAGETKAEDMLELTQLHEAKAAK